MAPMRTFRFRYGIFRPLLTVLGGGPRSSSVELDADRLRVRMGWWFGVEIPISAMTSVGPEELIAALVDRGVQQYGQDH